MKESSVIKNRRGCKGKWWKEHVWSNYSWDKTCQTCGMKQEVEWAGESSVGIALVLLGILWLLLKLIH